MIDRHRTSARTLGEEVAPDVEHAAGTDDVCNGGQTQSGKADSTSTALM
jgi:hypothetical protein